MNRRKAVWAGVIVLVAVAGTMASFRFRGDEADGAVRVSGNIEVTDVDVSFRIPGRVQERLVGEGMMVTRGQLVARLDIEDLEREVQLREAERRAAEAALRDLLAGSRPQEIEVARATVTRANAEAVGLGGGVEGGYYLAPGTPVVAVGDLTHVWLRAYIEEADLGRVKVGQPVTVTTDTDPGKKYTGRVSFIAPQAEFTPKSVQTQKERVKLVYRIKVVIPNPEMELKPGMPAEAVIRTGEGGG